MIMLNKALVVGGLAIAAVMASAAALALPASLSAASAPYGSASDLTWMDMAHNFGDVEQGRPVSHDFQFQNTSKNQILITNVKASCGCVATNYTKTPIKPGERGVVVATFNSRNPGVFVKTVTVTASGIAENMVLTIKGNVKSSGPDSF